ncbi:MAG: glycoside hydrolase family 3 N-terminal domain-containing protein [Caldimicrobium sp.]
MFKDLGKLFVVKPGSLSEEEKEFYRDLSFENFIFFRDHFENDFEEYLSCLKKALKSIKFLAVDQEGGRVCRIKGDFEKPLEMAKKAELEGIKIFIEWAGKIAETVKQHKLNLNLSPVIDRGDDEAPSFLNGRTFGKDPQVITNLGKLFIEEHKKRGIKTCLKHFPGLYGVKMDPHEELPLKEKLFEEDLYPFKALSSEAEFIMTTHLLLPEIDQTKPITFSEKAINFLRKVIEFKGAILTDDLAMGALKSYPLIERIILSLVSGHNLLIYCGSMTELMEALLEGKKELEKSSTLREKVKESLTILERY